MAGNYSTQVADKLRELAQDPKLDRLIAHVLPYGDQRRLMVLLQRVTPVDEVAAGNGREP